MGNMTLNGELMFIYQAFSAFNIWHGFEPNVSKDLIKFLDQ
jgi:shikimate dehydrogenase